MTRTARIVLLLLLLLPLEHIHAQSSDYRNHPLYWANRKPFPGYWQQDVHYRIDATLDDQSDRITGTMHLRYTNNSPDALEVLYLHLYQNMFEPKSYHYRFSEEEGPEEGDVYQHTAVSDLKVDGRLQSIERDNTVLIVHLDEPVRPGQEVTVECGFVTQFGDDHGRMKVYSAFGQKHYNVVHWYPRISVYDRKFGWTTDQHLGHEFYGDFGVFEVNITLPEQYVLDATGTLNNAREVLPEELLKKLDLKQFADKPWNEAPSVVVPASGKTKTWRFTAQHVHDFAWTADPTYRIGRAVAHLPSGAEVECIALAQEQHAAGWQNAAEYTARIIEVYSRDIGEYAYPKMIVADARDGMEYPMLTLDGGRDPGYRDLLAHEVGHNWFFGMVGSNETYRAMLDEGFTQFLTAWCMEALEGNPEDERGPLKMGIAPLSQRDAQVYNGYFSAAAGRSDDPALNTHSDHFDSYAQYGQVYYKTAVMLYNLQYVLGDSLFLSSMQHYFNQWKFCHPYVEDFRASIIDHSGVDLNWFFDQWLESEKKIDYSIRSFRKTDEGYRLKIKRKGSMHMPLDIEVETKSGKKIQYYIPNAYFQKADQDSILPRWIAWGDHDRDYECILRANEPIQSVVIDPSRRLADVNPMNDAFPRSVQVGFDNLQRDRFVRAYRVEWRPDLWYNGFDGLKVGAFFRGDYAGNKHDFDARIWFNSGIGQQSKTVFDATQLGDHYRFNYQVHYRTSLPNVAKKLQIRVESRWLDGLSGHTLGWEKSFPNGKTAIRQRFSSLYRPSAVALNYLLFPQEWNADRWNNFSEVELEHRYGYGAASRGVVNVNVRGPLLGSSYNYAFMNLESINDNRFSRFNWRTRVFAQLGTGSAWAPESRLYASGANPEALMDNPFLRSGGFIPGGWMSYGAATGNFQSGGGLNLRGYNGYWLPELNADSLVRFAYAGSSGAAFNTEFEFDDLLPIYRAGKRFVELKTYLFADAGIINANRTGESFALSNIRADAGVGVALDIKRWGDLSDIRPTTVRFDMPLFLNRPPASEEYVQFRWLIAFDRAF